MKKRIGILAIVLCLFLSLLAPALVHAHSIPGTASVQVQNAITVQSSTAQVDFPSKLTFNLSAASNVNLTDIRLRYILSRETFVPVFGEAFVEFNPAANVRASWVLDMQKTGDCLRGLLLTTGG